MHVSSGPPWFDVFLDLPCSGGFASVEGTGQVFCRTSCLGVYLGHEETVVMGFEEAGHRGKVFSYYFMSK